MNDGFSIGVMVHSTNNGFLWPLVTFAKRLPTLGGEPSYCFLLLREAHWRLRRRRYMYSRCFKFAGITLLILRVTCREGGKRRVPDDGSQTFDGL
jgi:hypothetical protein